MNHCYFISSFFCRPSGPHRFLLLLYSGFVRFLIAVVDQWCPATGYLGERLTQWMEELWLILIWIARVLDFHLLWIQCLIFTLMSYTLSKWSIQSHMWSLSVLTCTISVIFFSMYLSQFNICIMSSLSARHVIHLPMGLSRVFEQINPSLSFSQQDCDLLS